MLPSYRSGDRVLIRRLRGSKLGRGQVVVFEAALDGRWRTGPLSAPEKSEWLIKRVAALPGDPVPPEVARAVVASEGELVSEGRLGVIVVGPLSADTLISRYHPSVMERCGTVR